MSHSFTHADLEAYLDEALDVAQMAAIEQKLRKSRQLLRELAVLLQRRDEGLHSLGEIWRRGRLSCPTRDQLGSYLLEALDEAVAEYIRFHLGTVGCRWCQANLEDLRAQQADSGESTQQRRRKYFQSSAGYLRSGQ